MIHEVKPGDKFAVLALKTRTLDLPSTVQLSTAATASTSLPIALGSRCTEWLGTTRARRFASADLFLLATAPSKQPQLLDDENTALGEKLGRMRFGLLLTGPVVIDRSEVLLGAYGNYGLSIRSVSEHKRAQPIHGIPPAPIIEASLCKAWKTAEAIEQWIALGPAWRIDQAMRIFAYGRTEREIPERIHQFCRCVEGFILPDTGRTLRQLKSRTELFIGPGNHQLVEKIYNVRSAVEHLNYRWLAEQAGRGDHIEVARFAAIMEALARHCVDRLLSNNTLWPIFRTDDALAAFWTSPGASRRCIWGPPVAVNDLIGAFDEGRISDLDLGLA